MVVPFSGLVGNVRGMEQSATPQKKINGKTVEKIGQKLGKSGKNQVKNENKYGKDQAKYQEKRGKNHGGK